MRRTFLLGFLLLAVFDTMGQVCFKLTAIHAQPATFDLAWAVRVFLTWWLCGALAGYVGAFFTWMLLLKRLSVGSSFAASHLEVVSVMLVSYPLFNEPITLAKALGAAAILGGIACLAIAEEKLNRAAAE